MRVLGISAFYHDSAAALVGDGKIAAAAQEERFTRKKTRRRISARARWPIASRPAASNSTKSTTSSSTTSRSLKFERLLETYLAFAPTRLAARSAWRCRSGCAKSSFRSACCATSCGASRPDSSGAAKAAVHRASSEPRGQRVLPVSLRRGRGADHGRGRRMGHHHRRASGDGNRLEIVQGDSFPAFARPALLGLHLLHRLQGQLGRIQGDGPRALRRAQIRPAASSTSSSTSSPTALSGSIMELFRLLHRPAR